MNKDTKQTTVASKTISCSRSQSFRLLDSESGRSVQDEHHVRPRLVCPRSYKTAPVLVKSP